MMEQVHGWVRDASCPARSGRHIRGIRGQQAHCVFCGETVHVLSIRGKVTPPFTQTQFVIVEEEL